MTLADLSIKRPVFAWMLMIGIILFGLICYQRLGVSYMPDIDYPTLTIGVSWPGAAPEVIESELVDPIEQRVVAVEGVRQVRSSIGQGSASIALDFDINRNVDSALQEVEANVQQIRLPLNVHTPVIWKRNLEDDPIIRVVVYGNQPLRDMADYVDKYLQTALQTVDGVGDVSLGGFGARQLRIWIDNDKLKQYQLTVQDVQQAIEDQHEEAAGGYLENSKNEINVRTMGEAMTAEQVGDELILKRGSESIYNSTIHIRDVARVQDDLSDQRNITRADGQPAVVVNIKKQRGYNEVTVADNVLSKLDELKGALPPGMQAQVVVDYTQFTRTAVAETLHELIMAGILTSIICYLFLGTWSSALNVLVAIPTSVIGAFMALYILNFTLNLFTLLALRWRSASWWMTRSWCWKISCGTSTWEESQEGGAGRRAGDHFCGGGGDGGGRGDLHSGRFHERDHRTLFLPVLGDDDGGGAFFAAGIDHADADALLANAGQEQQGELSHEACRPAFSEPGGALPGGARLGAGPALAGAGWFVTALCALAGGSCLFAPGICPAAGPEFLPYPDRGADGFVADLHGRESLAGREVHQDHPGGDPLRHRHG